MFRIKTDIRQYKCETKAKVEKLIRNWVIRPNDLIYNADHKEWHPIGEHPAFVNLFGVLEQAEKNTPDTVVTARNPYAPSHKRDAPPPEVERSAPEPAEPAEAPDEDESETTEQEREELGVEPEDEPEEAADSESETAELDSESETAELDEVEPADDAAAEDEVDDETADDETADDESDDGETNDGETDDDETDDDGATADKTEDEEDAEEITHIVERPDFEDDEVETVEDARETDIFDEDEIAAVVEDDASAPPEAPEGVEPPSNDEVTMMTEKTLEMLKITDEDSTPESVEGDEEEAAEEEDEEITDVRDREPKDDASDDADEDEGEPSVIVAEETEEPPPGKPEPPAKPKVGRHDLPEELFATNEISSPQAREQLEKKLDDLGELSEPSEPDPEATPNHPEIPSPPAGVRLQEDSGVAEAWQEIAADLPSEVSEVSEVEVETIPAELLRETDEIERQIEEEVGDDWAEEDEDTKDAVVVPDDFISDGYSIPLPFEIGPTEDDIRLGLRPTNVSRGRRDRTFPLPQPKGPKEVQSRKFDLSPKPPRDRTILLMVGILLAIGLIAMIASNC